MRTEEFICERVKSLCKKNNISRYRLAQLTGLTQSALANIFKATSIPTIPTIERICQVFGISISQFFASDELDVYSYLSDSQIELLRVWESLDVRDREILISFIRSLDKR